MTEKFNWFAARLLFESRIDDSILPLFEERVVLIKSDLGKEDAEKKARKLGQASDLEYQNAEHEVVAWRFKEILDIVQLNETRIGEGSEVYHHYLKADEVEQVRESLKPGSL